MTTLLWFRRDLRLSDNPALAAALAAGAPVIPIFIRDDVEAGPRAPGGASRWWLHGSLSALAEALASRGSRLILRTGDAAGVLGQLLAETGARRVYWNRRYEPWAIAQERRVATVLQGAGVEAGSFNAGLLQEPGDIRTKQGGHFRVFTPFWKTLRVMPLPAAAGRAPASLPAPAIFPAGEPLAAWGLLPRPDWAGGLKTSWTPGEDGAAKRLAAFLEQAVFAYHQRRDFPGGDHTSRLSPHLHFGEIGPRQIWRTAIDSALARHGTPMPTGVEKFLAEIAWREFSYHLLFHYPHLPDAALRPEFGRFAWNADAVALKAWRKGLTGYPIVDAGMRELWATGWIHNRVRMIVASFLTKHLMIDWREGERWFWDTLVDADLASNAASWQWVAGCGADAAPYFRIFNPELQSVKFDADGAYIRRWVPELSRLPAHAVHAPWAALPLELAEAGVSLGGSYPRPIVEHGFARERALQSYRAAKIETNA